MAARRYRIRDAFRYEAYTPEGVLSGEFAPGVTGDDLTDEQAEYLEAHAIPAGHAEYVEDAEPVPPVPPAPSDTQEQQQ